jgi:hypothetical protein
MPFLQGTPESCLKYVIMTKTAYVTSFLSSSNSDFNVNRSSFFTEKHGAKLPPITWSDHIKWPCWISKRWSLYPRPQGASFQRLWKIVVLLNDWGTEVFFGKEIKGLHSLNSVILYLQDASLLVDQQDTHLQPSWPHSEGCCLDMI